MRVLGPRLATTGQHLHLELGYLPLAVRPAGLAAASSAAATAPSPSTDAVRPAFAATATSANVAASRATTVVGGIASHPCQATVIASHTASAVDPRSPLRPSPAQRRAAAGAFRSRRPCTA